MKLVIVLTLLMASVVVAIEDVAEVDQDVAEQRWGRWGGIGRGFGRHRYGRSIEDEDQITEESKKRRHGGSSRRKGRSIETEDEITDMATDEQRFRGYGGSRGGYRSGGGHRYGRSIDDQIAEESKKRRYGSSRKGRSVENEDQITEESKKRRYGGSSRRKGRSIETEEEVDITRPDESFLAFYPNERYY